MCLSFFFYKFGVFKNMYVFIWLRRVFVAACRSPIFLAARDR